MARPRKCRRICALPESASFGPLTGHGRDTAAGADGAEGELVVMTLDEYETIRLIDLLNCTQEECARQMDVARTTVQAVYNSARQKLARCLVEGRRLVIRGGDYRLCPEAGNCCRRNCGGRGGCPKRCGSAAIEGAGCALSDEGGQRKCVRRKERVK